MDVSILVVTFNGRAFTAPCLESVPAGVEIIVIDNGSTDGTPEAIAAGFPSAVVVRNPKNRGFAAAVNQGIERAKGKHVCLLNNDARLTPGALEKLVAHLEDHPDVAACAPQLLHENGRLQHSFDVIPSMATVFLNKSLLRAIFPKSYPSKNQAYEAPIEVPSVIGACMLLRREAIERVGGFDERFFVFLEETDWCLRAKRAGYRIDFVPDARVVHLQGLTRDRAAVRGRIEYVRSLFAFFRKHRPRATPLLRAVYPAKNLVELLFQTLAFPFSKRARIRCWETAALLGWQMLLCPPGMGLSPQEPPGEELQLDLSQATLLGEHRTKRKLRCETGGKIFLVKVYKERSPWQKLKAILLGPKAERDRAICRRLGRLAIPRVPVAGTGEAPDGSWVAVEFLPGWSQLQQVLLSEETDPGMRRRLLHAYGKFARMLHDAGVWQYDFNPTNVLVKDMDLKLIDFEKVKLYAGAVPESERLYLLAKMNRISGPSRADRLRFLKGYVQSCRKDVERFKAIAAGIRRFGDAQELHDNARAGQRCVKENRDFAPFVIGKVRGFYRKCRPGGPVKGLEPDELESLAETTNTNYRLEPADDPLGEWKRANIRARQGGAVPLAVLIKKGDFGGLIVYDREP